MDTNPNPSAEYVAHMATQSYLYVTRLEAKIMTVLDQFKRLADAYTKCQSDLAAALADDAADDAAVAAATAKAAELETANASLQALAEADAAEDSQISSLVDGLLGPAVEPPPVDPAPVTE